MFQGRFQSETWTGQCGLFTDWDYLLRECITVLLHEKKIQLGMLNPYAEIFIPQSQKNNQSNGNKGKCEDEVVDRKKIYENISNCRLRRGRLLQKLICIKNNQMIRI